MTMKAEFLSMSPVKTLNDAMAKVLKSILAVMRFWLDAGVDGLRLDAVPYLVERESKSHLPQGGLRFRSSCSAFCLAQISSARTSLYLLVPHAEAWA